MQKLGFGCMRLPMIPSTDEVDIELFTRLVDRYMEAGGNYYDTAHGYVGGKSESAMKAALLDRYPRESFWITDKISGEFLSMRSTIDDCWALVNSSFENLGTDWFDLFLVHCVSEENIGIYRHAGAFDVVKALKADGRAKHIGMSFHGYPQLLVELLDEHPEIEYVQIQFNWADLYASNVEAKKLYDILVERGKKILVMEPLKGGALADPPEDVKKLINEFNAKRGVDYSYASYGYRFAASFPGIEIVNSGMNTMEQLEDNIKTLIDFTPLDAEEMALMEQARKLIEKNNAIACTGCHYCTKGCPKQIPIPEIFATYNSEQRNTVKSNSWNNGMYYKFVVQNRGKASDCIKCGKCVKTCPQHLPVSDLMEVCRIEFEGA